MDQYRSWKNKAILYCKGMAMGSADIIPGVSGGTIALISGIYEHLIGAISYVKPSHALDIFRLLIPSRRSEAWESLMRIQWRFIIPLALGILSGLAIMIQIIPYVLEHYTFETYSVFFGLILFSITVPYKKMEKGMREIITAVLFGLLTFLIVGLSTVENLKTEVVEIQNEKVSTILEMRTDAKGSIEIPARPGNFEIYVFDEDGNRKSFPLSIKEANKNVPEKQESSALVTDKWRVHSEVKAVGDLEVLFRLKEDTIKATFSEQASTSLIYIFLCGALAISAMILPGISGAYILVLMGEYKFILESIESRDLVVLGSFAGGLLVGILSIVRLLKYMLEKHHSLTMAALTGIMIGSLRKIWPGHYISGVPDTSAILTGAGLAIAGALLLFILEQLSNRLQDPEPPTDS
ncbi:MAG: hypothetical protein CMN77_03545 [Spirochaetaceae bacterium]|nr:hypothetical protein [Spirochaetaceae bacterium]|tara:strand:+ start:56590 stop:57813 length:1224 start_codon:yes stop_codon:yes gene_type:complete